MIASNDICKQAIASIKAEGCAEPAVTLSKSDEPVLRSLGNGLLASYVIDAENAFHFVQHRHLLEQA